MDEQTTRPNDLGGLRKSEVIGGLLYWPVYLWGAQYLALWIAGALGVDTGKETALAPVNLIFGCLNLLILLPIFSRYLADQLRRLTGRGWRLFGDLLMGYLFYFGLSYLVSLVMSALVVSAGLDYFNLNEEAVEAAVRMTPWMMILVACVLAPLAEELLCRGLIFCGLYRRSRLWAYGLSMLMFSLLHVYAAAPHQPLSVTGLNLIIYLPAGYALARTYERTGTIWSSILLHSFINMISLLVQASLR